jgi:hypothetical protein
MLSLAAALPAAEPELKISPTIYFQTRADINSGTTSTGDDYTPGTEGTSAVEGDTVDFYLRRARVGAKFTYGNWSGRILLESDNAFRNGTTSKNGSASGETTGRFLTSISGTTANAVTKSNGYSNGSLDVGLYDVYATYVLKGDAVNHEFRAGVYTAVFNPSDYYSSGAHAFAASAITQNLISNRQAGVGYTLDHEVVDLSLDIQNVKGDGTSGQGLGGDGDGLWISGRAVLTLPGEWNIGKWQESFAGAEGQGVALGLEYATQDDQTATTVTTETTSYGIDVLLHMDGLTALAEYRGQTDDNGTAEKDSTVWRIQAAYAFPVADTGYFIEPALRYGSYDADTDNDNEAGNFGTSDYGTASGDEIDVGVNWLISGNKNKISMLYTTWSAEEGDGDASIFRVQHQISF